MGDCQEIKCQDFKLRENFTNFIRPGFFNKSRMVIDMENGVFIIMSASRLDDDGKRFQVRFNTADEDYDYTNNPYDVTVKMSSSFADESIIYPTESPIFKRYVGDSISFVCAVSGKYESILSVYILNNFKNYFTYQLKNLFQNFLDS